MKKEKNTLWKKLRGTLVISLALCISMVMILFPASSAETAADGTEPETVDIVVTKNDVKQGAKIKKSDLEIKTIKNKNVPKNAITDIADVSGKYAKVALYAGEYVYKDLISKESVAPTNNHLLIQNITTSKDNYVVVTDYIPANTGEDVTTLIQSLFDKNAGRTIFFPDGEYIISRPLKTYAVPSSTISILLADGAVIKADAENWKADGSITSMIALGGYNAGDSSTNDIRSQGSYYTLQGGTIDCSGVADGVSIDWGRESLIRNILILNSDIGVRVKKGMNSGSSDIDFEDLTIIGNGKSGSVGLDIIGYDNTFSNMHIYDCQTGVRCSSGGNSFRNIQVYFTHCEKTSKLIYANTVGIDEIEQGNFYYHCYVENYATAYSLNGTMEIVDNCRAKWTSNAGGVQTAFVTKQAFNSCFSNVRVEFFDASTTNMVFVPKNGGNGTFESPMITNSLCDGGMPNIRNAFISLG